MVNDTKLAKSLSYKSLAGLADNSDEEVKAYMKDAAKTNTIIAGVAGEITSYTVKNGQYGENVAFSGQFIAQSAITGEIWESTKMFFDKGFTDQLRAQFDKRQDNEMVKFSAQITVVTSSKAPFFTYMATPLKTPEAISRRAELLGTLASAPLQIAQKKAKA